MPACPWASLGTGLLQAPPNGWCCQQSGPWGERLGPWPAGRGSGNGNAAAPVLLAGGLWSAPHSSRRPASAASARSGSVHDVADRRPGPRSTPPAHSRRALTPRPPSGSVLVASFPGARHARTCWLAQSSRPPQGRAARSSVTGCLGCAVFRAAPRWQSCSCTLWLRPDGNRHFRLGAFPARKSSDQAAVKRPADGRGYFRSRSHG
jgi:hypothetical protein